MRQPSSLVFLFFFATQYSAHRSWGCRVFQIAKWCDNSTDIDKADMNFSHKHFNAFKLLQRHLAFHIISFTCYIFENRHICQADNIWHSCNWMDLASLLNSFVPLSILETLCCHLTLLTELGVFCHEQWPWDTVHCMLHSCMWQIFVVSKEVSRVHPIFSFYSPLADCVLIDK